MRHRWPEDTRFTRVVLEVEDNVCAVCGGALHICDHRRHRIFTLQGPVEVVCKLAHCSDRQCAARAKTRSPYAETTLTLPWWLIGWDVFCWMGHRRFARHWSVPQIRGELADTYQIPLSADAIEDALRRYQTMLAARQQDPQVVAAAYRNVEALVLSIDGLQPEKGHETLYVVRELNAKRIWFAEALLSSSADEVRRLLIQARAWATQLGLPVHLWLSDKQDAFVTGIAAEFPGVPHRYCVNHFLRDLAKPMLEADSHAKVKMRRKVRGLRTIEREVLQQRRPIAAEAPAVAPVAMPPAGEPPAVVPAATPPVTHPPAHQLAKDVPAATAPPADAGEVVLDYCSAVRGILNDDQGGPLQPPGLRMAEALGDVRASLQRNLDANRGGRAHTQLQRLAACIDRGVAEVQAEHHGRPSAPARDRACRGHADQCERFGHGAAGPVHALARGVRRPRHPVLPPRGGGDGQLCRRTLRRWRHAAMPPGQLGSGALVSEAQRARATHPRAPACWGAHCSGRPNALAGVGRPCDAS